MKQKYPFALLLLSVTLFSCKPKKAENLEEMARLATRPEAVLVKTVKLEKSTFYHELISNVVFNKTTNKAGIFKNAEVKTNAQVWVKNDLDGIAPFTPMNRSGYLFYHDDCLYCVLEAKEFSDAYGTASEQNKTSTKYLRKMATAFSSVNEFSNPVIMKVHLK